MIYDFDVIVIGAGHAGCEAACAAANLGSTTLLITIDMNKIAQMSCNPAVGGIAKGQIVREIDALGGQMGIVTDRSSLQFRMLNRSKGPAMWSPRAQADRMRFIMNWRHTIENTPNLYMWQDSAVKLDIANGEVHGVTTALGVDFTAKAVVLTAGTFLNGLMHVGPVKMQGGRVAEPASHGITEQLRALGFATSRMKTGTPVRLDARTIDFSQATVQEGDHDFHHFSFLPTVHSELRQRPCYIVWTNPQVHDVLRAGLPESPLFNGQIQSVGPRYCPSIETKLVTFPDKDAHQLFIEPEGESTNEMYLNGFSSSMPWRIQLDALSKIPALAHVQAYRPGYAIEYDYFDPTQLKHNLETKLVKNLFFAGQVNGTTGYEEAAGQGLVAGINAHQNAVGAAPFVLARDEAYIGVLIDDLVTKGVDEPYRMFTSRAEHRILLRQDDADLRLTPRSYALGLASRERYLLMQSKWRQVDSLVDFARDYSVKASLVNPSLEARGLQSLRQGTKLYDLILRPQLGINLLATMIPELQTRLDALEDTRREEIVEAAEIRIKYHGYIEREQLIAQKIGRLEHVKIKGKFDYSSLHALSTEARQKLQRIDPETVGQASRIPGISPSDINILLLLLGR
ncbi:MAG: tRNA uridine-5-carboxymethylaminomethyl(34) synthesis enzyme MnmG [Sodaliphilus pleomorphus]|uniref:tRNA uridine-5-carboxymethylaminomethyl(34) synthesis enzyme MnmG n=1 Tax=Sodaliphilus pleomorphus TaxID=2606626 RepID=UPI0023F37DA0|nr:tRNA uridine-5-carboxymethylaminomethyl(34) synthesis enzyme MnmG [Sodaliphilus pleomorphus]MDD7065590.1 tRNA uridine-5-carboxymethylaminomethyl(34) synthesis enzyme MnmG [Sodaliphilus pleomorphus]MDY2832390.1 tRNA uridine-5-carboxymethylaminomethyl(34) synthesis enzyme MnmG [Sodaliphilus pleomorphus]